ncbi:MAG: oligosaccharide flippase family protein [Deltaproteobacteria bacterium]|nr:oligosaccharide flippase family protein [Deltaproteobacteria bacterium]MBW2152306.1 oligosaccharide flippase family protein [Deltaproteobacteria bacterium]
MSTVAKDTIRQSKVLLFGSSAKQAGRFLHGYFGAFLLGPALYGLWQGVRLILNYGVYINLGTIYGMERQIPFYKGKRDYHRLKLTESVIFVFNILVTSVLAIAVISAGISWRSDQNLRIALIFVGLILWAKLIQAYYTYYMRANQKFELLSIIGGVDFFCSIISIYLIYQGGFVGFLSGFLLRGVVTLFVAIRLSNSKLELKWDSETFKENIYFGFPLMLGGIVSVLFQSIDRVIILSFLDIEQLGFYSLGILVIRPLSMIMNSVLNVVFPKMTEAYGSNEHPESIRKYVQKPLRAVGCIAPVIIGFIHLNLFMLVTIFLPKYQAGINAAIILIYGLLFHHLTSVLERFWVTLGRQYMVLIMVFTGCIIKLVFSLIMLINGYGINGVALSSSLSYLIIFTSMSLISFKILKISRKRMLKDFIILFISVCYILFVCHEISTHYSVILPDGDIQITALIKQQTVFALLSLPLIYLIYKELGLYKIKLFLKIR